MDELIFANALRQKLASAVVQIVSIDKLHKELSPAYNFNISSLKIHVKVIIIIL